MSSFVDSKKRELSQEEIIKIAAKEIGGKHSVDEIKASLVLEVHELKGLLIRQGNTIFIVHQSKENPKVAVFRALNADTIPNYLKNSVTFTKAMGLAGFQYLVTQFKDAPILNIFKYVYRHQPFPNMGYFVQRTEDKQYRVTVNLGDVKPQGGLPDRAVPQVQGGL